MAVLAGWYLHLPSFIQINPTFAPMQYNTALGFLLCGLGLLFLNLDKLGLNKGFGSLAVLLGTLTLFQYIFGLNLGIDEFFMEAYITVNTSHPGRMAPNTALCFILSGVVLIILGTSSLKITRKLMSAAVLTMVIAVLCASAFLGYMGHLETTIGWGRLTRMALHTSLGFLVVASGIFTHIWFISKRFRAHYSAFQIALASSAVIVLSTLTAVAQYSNENKLIKTSIEHKGIAIKNELTTEVYLETEALIRMAKRWAAQDIIEQLVWEADAKSYIEDFEGIVSVQWFGPELKKHWSVHELNGDQASIDLFDLQEKHSILEKTKALKETWISESFNFNPSDKGFFVVVPIYSNYQFKGLIMGIFAMQQLLAALPQSQHNENYSLKIYEKNEILFQREIVDEALKTKWSHKEEVRPYNAQWTLYLWPSGDELSQSQTYLPHVMFVLGLLLSYLLGSTIHLYYQVSREKELITKIKRDNELILKSAGDGIFGLDLADKITFINPAGQKMLGYTEHELLGKLQHATIHHTKPDGSHFPREDCHIYAAITDGKSHSETEEVFWRKDRSSFPVEYISTPIKENGNVMGAVVSFRNITERKRKDHLIAEFTQDIKKTNEKITRSNKELDDFAYIVSHDLKEPLRGIYNYSEFLKEDYSELLDDEGKSKLDTLVRLSQRIELLINNILTYARLGRTEIKLESVDLNKLLLEILDNLQFLRTESGVDIRVPHPLPVFICDKTWVKEVFHNLITNALKYNDKDEKWVEVGCISNGVSESTMPSIGNTNKNSSVLPVFYVQDNGIGIPERHHDSLFRIFKRLTGKKQFGDGAGAGTTIAKKVIELHNGRIWLKSTEGKGTTFYFTLGEAEEKHELN